MSGGKTDEKLFDSILGFIIGFKALYNGCSPTLEDCCEHVQATRGGSCSRSYMSFLLGEMEERHMVVRLDDLESRNLAVPGYSWRKENEE